MRAREEPSMKLGKHRRRRFRGRTKPGAAPGTIAVDPTAPKPKIRILAYGPDGVQETEVEDPAEIRGHLDGKPVVWVNVDGLGDAEVLKALGEAFGIHKLALEDVVNVHQRDKVEPYEEHLFIVARMANLPEDTLATEQVSLFLGANYVVTFQEREGDCLDPVRDRIRQGKGRIRKAGPDYLAYAILDAIVDHYFPILEAYGERLDHLEDEIMEEPTRATLARVHRTKRELLSLRRAAWPKREALSTLLREPSPLVSPETGVYLRDCYDHAVQILDITETYRELGSGLVDAYLSNVSNRMNEIMQVLTIIATIFIPLTFLAGIYGMNFSYMPETQWRWGYFAAIGVMAAIAVGLVLFFRRRGWLGGRRRPVTPPEEGA
jgi:magnesium transporter